MSKWRRVVKIKRDTKKRPGGVRHARALTNRVDQEVDNVRRLQLVEGGRQGAKPRQRVSDPPARQRHAVPRKVRRRRRLATLVLALLAAGLITYILLAPTLRFIESRRNLSRVKAQFAEEQSRTQALQDKKELEMKDEFVEGKARESGYVKLGEIPIIVLDVPQDQAPDTSQDSTNPDAASNPSSSERAGP